MAKHSNFSYYERRNTFGWTLFQQVQSYQSIKIIDYILAQEDAQGVLDSTLDFVLAEDLKYEDRYHPYWRFMSHCQAHAIDLIKAGASISSVYFDGNTVLHRAIYGHHLQLIEFLLEEGADVNARNSHGCTALHRVCVESWDKPDECYPCLATLLFYGADPCIEDDEGYTPFEYSVRHYSEMAQEILFDYTFDDFIKIHFDILVKLASRQSKCFSLMVERAEIVSCEHLVHNRFCLESLLTMDYHNLEVLVKNYRFFIEEIISFCIAEVSDGEKHNVPEFLLKYKNSENFKILLDCIPGNWFPQFISPLCFDIREGKDESYVSENLLFLLSYGLELTEQHLLAVYKGFGHSELFKILLHMDFSRRNMPVSAPELPSLFYDIHLTYNLINFLEYFANRRMKEEEENPVVIRYPEIPLLVELARDAFRKFFIEKLEIKTTRRFYTLLRHLPVSSVYKKIISYETKLYHRF